jgi:hypothetical protein
MALHGVVLAAKTKRRNDRFRILVFDARGDVRYQVRTSTWRPCSGVRVQGRAFLVRVACVSPSLFLCACLQAEASPSQEGGPAAKPVARCRLFLAPYSTLAVGAPFPSVDDTPPICHALDTLEERGPCAPAAGAHLCAIYNDNFLSGIGTETGGGCVPKWFAV